LNYERYQSKDEAQGTRSGRRSGSRRAREGHERGTSGATNANNDGPSSVLKNGEEGRRREKKADTPRRPKSGGDVRQCLSSVSTETDSSSPGGDGGGDGTHKFSLTNLPFDTLSRVRQPKKANDQEAFAAWFAEFWELYPRKVAKSPAEKAARKAVKKHGAEVVLAGLRRQLPALRAKDPQYIPHPSTWLNEERWNDEPEPAGNPGGGDYPEWGGVK